MLSCGGGSSKFGRLEAFGLRAVKLGGAPIDSGPENMWDGRATAAATMTVAGFDVPKPTEVSR